MKTALWTALLLSTSVFAQEWKLEIGPRWLVEGEIDKGKDVSGAAMVCEIQGWLVSDETRVAQSFTLDRAAKRMVVGASEDLLPGDGKEMDLEGVAAEGGVAYFTASHGVSRKDGSVKPDRMLVARLRDGTATVSGRLAASLGTDPRLKRAVGRSLEEDGLDIEGIAAKDAELFFGLRSPNLAGKGFVVEVAEAPFFTASDDVGFKVHDLELGEGVGIRDVVAVKDGFVLITGPEAAGDEPFELRFWPGPGAEASRVGRLPAGESKAEGLMLIGEKPDEIVLLALFDGDANGAPLELNVWRSVK